MQFSTMHAARKTLAIAHLHAQPYIAMKDDHALQLADAPEPDGCTTIHTLAESNSRWRAAPLLLHRLLSPMVLMLAGRCAAGLLPWAHPSFCSIRLRQQLLRLRLHLRAWYCGCMRRCDPPSHCHWSISRRWRLQRCFCCLATSSVASRPAVTPGMAHYSVGKPAATHARVPAPNAAAMCQQHLYVSCTAILYNHVWCAGAPPCTLMTSEKPCTFASLTAACADRLQCNRSCIKAVSSFSMQSVTTCSAHCQVLHRTALHCTGGMWGLQQSWHTCPTGR